MRFALIGLSLVAAYAILAGLVMIFQRHLIYLPSKLVPRLAEQLAAKEGLLPWRNQAGELIGWHLPANQPPVGVALFFHGNAGSAIDRGYLFQPLHQAVALDIFILEYPGYGARPGSPSQSSILAAAEEAFTALPKQLPVYLVAESLGTGAATHLARTFPAAVRGMALFVPYNKLASVGQRQMPFLPVSWLLLDKFDPEEWLKKYDGPISFVLAGADEVIPIDLGQRLANTYGGPKHVLLMPGAGHNDVAGQSPEWWRDTVAFWRTTAK